MRLPLPVTNRKALLVVGVLTAIALLVTAGIMFFSIQESLKQPSARLPNGTAPVTVEDLKTFLCDRRDAEILAQVYYLAPLLGFIAVLGGTLAWYYTGAKMQRQETTLKKNTGIILNFLSDEEQAAIRHLLQKGGTCPQFDLAHLPGTNKVKMHRILTKIEQKGIIRRERQGKTNMVVLDQELYDVLKD